MEDQAKRKLESKDERQSKTPRREASLKSTLNGTYIELDGKTCYHQIAWPKDQMEEESFPPVYDGILAKNYPFELDPFQTTAIACLEAGSTLFKSSKTDLLTIRRFRFSFCSYFCRKNCCCSICLCHGFTVGFCFIRKERNTSLGTKQG